MNRIIIVNRHTVRESHPRDRKQNWGGAGGGAARRRPPHPQVSHQPIPAWGMNDSISDTSSIIAHRIPIRFLFTMMLLKLLTQHMRQTGGPQHFTH